jgi:hypothetical protein
MADGSCKHCQELAGLREQMELERREKRMRAAANIAEGVRSDWLQCVQLGIITISSNSTEVNK